MSSSVSETVPAIIRDSLFVAAGGAVGTLFRHLINLVTFIPGWPVGTVVENLTGAFLLGITAGWLATRKSAPGWVRKGIGVGFCGGYTTMSTFAADSFVVHIHQAPGWAAGYVAVSLVFGLLLAAGGLEVGRRIGRSKGEKR